MQHSGFLASANFQRLLRVTFTTTLGVWVIGIVFKRLVLPGTDILIVASFSTFAYLAILSAFAGKVEGGQHLGLMPRPFIGFWNYVSLGVLIIGFLFKIQHWPGGDLLIILAFMAFSCLAFIRGFLFLLTPKNARPPWVFSFFVAQSLVIISGLFWVQHWPGSKSILLTGLASLLFMILVYGSVLAKQGVKLISFSNRFTFIFAITIITVWSYSDAIKVRLTRQELESGFSLHQQVVDQMNRGDVLLKSISRNNPKLEHNLSRVNQETARIIAGIESLKMEILLASHENTKLGKKQDYEALFWSSYKKNNPLIPAQLNFYGLQHKQSFDESMRVLGIASDEFNGESFHKGVYLLYLPLRKFQTNMLTLVANIGSDDDNQLVFDDIDPNVCAFEEVLQVLKDKKVRNENLISAASIYSDFGLQKDVLHLDGNSEHWLMVNFDHAPLIKVMVILSQLELKVAKARFEVLSQLALRSTP